MDSVDNLANLRVASFSYYLKSNDQENFVQKLTRPEQNPTPDDTAFSLAPSRTKSPYSINFSDCPVENVKVKQLSAFLNDPQEDFMFKVKRPSMDAKSQTAGQPRSRTNERIKSIDGEIDIFGADKYFNMKLECPPPAKMKPAEATKRDDRTVDIDPFRSKPNLRQEAPSVCSEASTWSSGVALLQNLPRNLSQKKPRKFTGSRFFSTIGCTCTGPCFDKKTVYASQNSKCQRNQSGLNTGISNFTFPLVDVVKPSLEHNIKKLEDQTIEDLRKSIEVFGSDTMKKDEITKNLERRLSMLTWDAIPKSTSSSLPITSTNVVIATTACDDMASDVSSDLFEIENISASCGGPYMTTKDYSVDDVSSGMTPTTADQYAPSEASFEWSVVTASAADFSSAVSDYDLKHGGVLSNEEGQLAKGKNSIQSKEDPKSRHAGGLLGCKSLKSLNVAETVHKTKVERY